MQLCAFCDNIFYKGADSQMLVIIVNYFNADVDLQNSLLKIFDRVLNSQDLFYSIKISFFLFTLLTC